MRSHLIVASALLTGFGFLPATAEAQELSANLASRYIDTDTFNDVFSDEAVLKLEGSYDLSKHLYVSGYVYTGFSKPFKDNSSEYAFEVGGTWDLSDHIKAGIAAGRYANYQGRGFDQGDWYVKATASYERLSVSASVLRGVSDTALLGVSYNVPVTDKLSVKPSVVFYTADGRLNPAVDATYRLNDRLSVNAVVVIPQNSTGGRTAYGAIGLIASF